MERRFDHSIAHIPISVQRCLGPIRKPLLRLPEGVVSRDRLTVFANIGHHGVHERIDAREHLVLKAERVKSAHPFCQNYAAARSRQLLGDELNFSRLME
jgi:hypothetical protein